ncbi:MAG TPA: hypothetical protein VGC79_04380, partial [Polyangiaceae bacterium]
TGTAPASASATRAAPGAELQSHAAQPPEPTPLSSLNTAENSVVEAAPEPAPSASSLPAVKKLSHPHNSLKAPLQKKGNERYGRFE